MVTQQTVNNLELTYGVVIMILVISCQTCYRIKVNKGITPGRNARHAFFVLLALSFIALGYATLDWYVPTMYLVGAMVIASIKDLFQRV